MALICLMDINQKGRNYKKGESIVVDVEKVEVFIAKGWAQDSAPAVNEIQVEAKELKPKRQTKEFKVDIQTKSDEADQD